MTPVKGTEESHTLHGREEYRWQDEFMNMSGGNRLRMTRKSFVSRGGASLRYPAHGWDRGEEEVEVG